MRILFLLFSIWFFSSCQCTPAKIKKPPLLEHLPTATLEIHQENIEVFVARELKDQVQGLSGTRPEDFGHGHALLFFYQEDGFRRFWMPETFMNLDLFYLDRYYKVIDIVRDLKKHPERGNEALIPRAPEIWARHVLEMRSDSPLAKRIQKGDVLKINFIDLKKPSEIRLQQ